MRSKALKIASFVVALTLATALLLTALRARRLLRGSAEIAAQSASFPRDYTLGSGPQLTYLVMGDSTAAGFGAGRFEATYPHQIALALAARGFRVHVVNVAVGGATLAQVRRDQSAALDRVRPDLISLSVGANDATHRTSDADFERELGALQADFAASHAQAVLMANVPDMFLAPALPFPFALTCGRRARALNAVLSRQKPISKIRVVDLYGAGKLDYRRDPALYAADLFHPSGRGYALWAQLFVSELPTDAIFSASKRAAQR